MNIFALSRDAHEAAELMAQYESKNKYPKRRINKMIIESAQLLSTAHRILDGDDCIDGVYKATHKNHPCAIWARESAANYKWLYQHMLSLHQVIGSNPHKTITEKAPVLSTLPKNIPDAAMTEFRKCMPDKYKVDDAVQSYHNYYQAEKD